MATEPAPASDLAPTLERCLRAHLPLLGEHDRVDLSTDLFELGLDSMSAIALLLSLEEAFGVTFPDELLNPTVFRTGETLLSAVRELLAAQTG
jgi:acyl carrier protein